MNGLGLRIGGIPVCMVRMIDMLREYLAILIRTGPRVAFEELINRLVAASTVASIEVHAAPRPEFLPTGKVLFTGGDTLRDLDVVLSKSVLSLAEAGKASDIEKAVADLIGDISPFRPSASQAVNSSFATKSGDYKPLVVDQAPAILGV